MIALLCGRAAERYSVSAPGESYEATIVGQVFQWIVHGKGVFRVDGKEYTARADDIFLFRSRQKLEWNNDPLEPTLVHSFCLWVDPLPTGWPPPSRWPIRRNMPDNDVIRPLFEYILGNAPEHGGKPPVALTSAAETLMSAYIFGPLVRQAIAPHVYPSAVQKVLVFINNLIIATPSNKVTLDELASIGGVSREHLCRLFRQYVGYAPLEVLYLYRLTRSLIGLNTGQTIESLANEFGFADASHYVRRFTSFFGKSPGQMRRAMAKGYQPKMPKLPNMG